MPRGPLYFNLPEPTACLHTGDIEGKQKSTNTSNADGRETRKQTHSTRVPCLERVGPAFLPINILFYSQFTFTTPQSPRGWLHVQSSPSGFPTRRHFFFSPSRAVGCDPNKCAGSAGPPLQYRRRTPKKLDAWRPLSVRKSEKKTGLVVPVRLPFFFPSLSLSLSL